jgi:hypothetical protein
MPDEPEALGLLALMVLHHARSAARTDDAGDLVTRSTRTAPCGTPPPSARHPRSWTPRSASAGQAPTS